MAKTFKWWKDKDFLKIAAVAITVMAASFLLAYFIEWGWIAAIIAAKAGGAIIRKIITKRLDNLT
jgi:hypothetical protein